MGHHPAHAVNGFSGAYARDLAPECAGAFWDVLVRHGVLAYLCSHILAFDVQVHRGVLQVTTAGAGTAHRMPEGIEYLHLLQAALDGEGRVYQVLDDAGVVRERLDWPPRWPEAGGSGSGRACMRRRCGGRLALRRRWHCGSAGRRRRGWRRRRRCLSRMRRGCWGRSGSGWRGRRSG